LPGGGLGGQRLLFAMRAAVSLVVAPAPCRKRASGRESARSRLDSRARSHRPRTRACGAVCRAARDHGAEIESAACVRPAGVQQIVFAARKYPNVPRHFRGAVRRGVARWLVLNRRGADARRERLLRDIPTRAGFDRDEYPPAVGRGRGSGLERGRRPRGWKADVRLVPSSENRSHGASLGGQLERFCNGTRFRYVFR
jgi:hypothetical protein